MTQEQNTAKKITEALDRGVAELDAITIDKLAAARKQAVSVMVQPASVAHLEPAHAGVGQFIIEHMHGQRAWTAMALLLVAGLLVFAVLQQNSINEPVEADALLLASELPPEAYIDKGFDAWLENSSQL